MDYMSDSQAFNEVLASAIEHVDCLQDIGFFKSADRVTQAIKVIKRYRMEHDV